MTADDDKADDQTATATADNDATADVHDSPRNAAAELHSEAPTTIVPDVTVLTAWCDLEVAHRDCDQLGGGHQQWAVDK